MSTITLKAGSGYNVPWFVSEAADAEGHRKNILDFVGLAGDEQDEHGNNLADLSLMHLTLKANAMFAGALSVYGMTDQSKAASKPSGNAEVTEAKPVEKQKRDDNSQEIIRIITETDDVNELKKFYVKHKSEIDKLPEAMKALQAKFKK